VREGGTNWRVMLERRLVTGAVALGIWALAIEGRLAYLQIVQRPELEARAERQHTRTIRPPGKRGDIVDRRGRLLATSVDAESIYAVPSAIVDAPAAVKALCSALGDCSARDRQTLLEKFGRPRGFEYVRRQVAPDVTRRVADLNLDGIGFLKESRRFYPNKELAAHLLGYVGIDNEGLNGIEFAYDSQIRGVEGTLLVNADARRRVFSRVERPPEAGSSLELTIDEYIQHVAERELRAGVAENRAAGGSAIVMDPRTGEILAMANEPTFNPNAFGDFSDNRRRNRGVQDLYEPGSTFKIVTASAAIEEKVVPLDSYIDTTPGILRIGTRVIDEFRGHTYGVLSFTDVIVRSSNVGAVKIGLRLGPERLGRYVERFGFGRPISPDFPGESPGIVWGREKLTDGAIASVAMGYQVGVTPLQMVAAVGAIANGGELVEPRAVRAAYRGGRRLEVTPKGLRRVVSRDTAAAITSIMEEVVNRGTGTLAQLPGYAIAGKTGTASKLINGRYSATENNASFVGFVPSRDPAVVIIVVIDAPHANGNSGGGVSAPIFRRIAEPTLRYLGVAPTIDPIPPVLVARAERAPRVSLTSADSPGRVVSLAGEPRDGTMPDLRGLSARDAVRALARIGMAARMSGDGIVVGQSPAPGTLFQAGAVARLDLARVPLPDVSAGDGTQP
jgi:cell division protein FtsI (penicillin-binding protein 3)